MKKEATVIETSAKVALSRPLTGLEQSIYSAICRIAEKGKIFDPYQVRKNMAGMDAGVSDDEIRAGIDRLSTTFITLEYPMDIVIRGAQKGDTCRMVMRTHMLPVSCTAISSSERRNWNYELVGDLYRFDFEKATVDERM